MLGDFRVDLEELVIRLNGLLTELERMAATQTQILNNTKKILKQEILMSEELDALSARVEETLSVEQSAIVLINGIAARIDAAKDDPVKMRALAAELTSKSAELAAAVAANTPPNPE